jgi:hypothetical protein
MKNNYLWGIVLFLLMVSAAGNYIQWKNANEEQNNAYAQNRRNQETIQRAGDSIKTAAARINELEAKGIRTRDSAKVAQNAAKREIQAYRQTIAKLRPLVQAKIDSFPDLREFVSSQDSVISKQDSLLHDTELFCQLQVRDLQDIIRLQEQKYHAQAEISEAWRQQAVESQAEAKKERRGKKFWQWTAGIAAGVALYLSVKQ